MEERRDWLSTPIPPGNSLIVISDLHVHNFPLFGGDRIPEGMSIHDEIEGDKRFPGCNRRAVNILNAFERVIQYADRNAVKTILLLGDVFHTKGSVLVPVFNGMTKVLEYASSLGITVLAIPGNHDYLGKSANWSSLNTLYSLPHIAVAFTPTVEVIKVGRYKLAAMFIPYMARREVILQEIRRLGDAVIQLLRSGEASHAGLFMHVSIKGAVTGSHEYVMREPLELKELPLDLFNIVMSGHVHRQQIMRYKNFKFVYCGNLVQQNFGERTYKPGWMRLDFDDEQIRLIFVENKRSPRFEEVIINTRAQLEALINKVNAEKSPSVFVRAHWKGDVYPKDLDVPSDRLDVRRLPRVDIKPRLEIDLIKETDESLVKLWVKQMAGERSDQAELVDMGLRLVTETK